VSARRDLHGGRVRHSFLHLADEAREAALTLCRRWWIRLDDVQRDAPERWRARDGWLASAAGDRVVRAAPSRAPDLAVKKD
jgi:hypothetical protein